MQATDAAGNSGKPASYGWAVDAVTAQPKDITPPTVTITSDPADPDEEHAGEPLLRRRRGGRQPPVPPRRPSLLGLHEPEDVQRSLGGRARLRREGDRRGRQHGIRSNLQLDRRHEPADGDDHPRPADPTKSTQASLSFDAGEADVSFQCRLDGQAFSACTSPKTYSDLSAGEHAFAVQATDAAGNTGSAATYSWTVDTSPPTVTITSRLADPTKSTQASLSFRASEADVSFQCGLDGGALTACTSPKVDSRLSDGRHTFSVQATDAAGNAGSAATYSWTVDTSPPTVTITGPADPTKSTQASLSFHASEADVSFQCRLDGQAFSACTSPKVYSGLSDSRHTFSVQATDAAGNTGPATTYSWTVQPPEIYLR